VRPERKNIARAGDGDSIRLGCERPLLDGVVRFAKDDLVDLIESEAGDFDRSVGQDQLLELNLQLIKVPLALLPKAVDGEAQDALLLLAQIFDPDTRRTAKAEKPRRLDPYGAVEDKVVLANQDRRAEAERADRIGDLAHMGGVKLAKLAAWYPQILEEGVHKIEWRQQVVTCCTWGAADPAKRLRLSRRARLLALRPLVSERAASKESRSILPMVCSLLLAPANLYRCLS
jgi:hypothetical protein